MGLFARILGLCNTKLPDDAGSWKYSAGKIEIELNRVPELSEPGDAIRLEGMGLPEKVLVYNEGDGTFHAFRNRCTHMGGRRLDPLPGTGNIRCCSVSKSTFNLSGEVVSGPAQKPLTSYPVKTEAQKLIVLLNA